MSVIIGPAADRHLQGILDLQEANLKKNLTPEVIASQGFVTVKHDFDILKAMNDVHPHSIALDGNTVVGYALAMATSFVDDIPFLQSLFGRIDQHLKSIDPSDPLNYVVMGQICVGVGYRSQGIFAGMYHNLRDRLSYQYDSMFTDISCENTRSLRAHTKVGFQSIEIFEVEDEKWDIVQWKW